MTLRGSLLSRVLELKSMLAYGVNLMLSGVASLLREHGPAGDFQAYWNSPDGDLGWESDSQWLNGSDLWDGDSWPAHGGEGLAYLLSATAPTRESAPMNNRAIVHFRGRVLVVLGVVAVLAILWRRRSSHAPVGRVGRCR